MGVVIGWVVVLVMVFGGYLMAGGKMEIIVKALPFELMMIGGAAIGAFIVSNKKVVGFGTLKAFGYAFKGPHWNKQDYLDLLCLMFLLCKTIRTSGLISLEAHLENPKESSIFKQYPRILDDHFAMDLICDTLRMLTMGVENPHQVEDMIEKKIEKYHHEHAAPAHALQSVADALPAIGIVAAVLGVIKTMASINEPPAILGKMIGGALVGTFLGVFLAYCIVGPLSSKLTQVFDEDQKFYFVIRDVLIAHLNNSPPIVSVEFGRGHAPGHLQPSFLEMETACNATKLPA